MAEPSQQEEFLPDPHDFMRNAHKHAKTAGACVLEFFGCDRCMHSFTATHSFAESVACPHCKNRMPSKVPRLPQQGEITVEGFVAAITCMRQTYPEPDEATKQWISSQSPAVKAVCSSFGLVTLHNALNSLQEMARKMSGGHTA